MKWLRDFLVVCALVMIAVPVLAQDIPVTTTGGSQTGPAPVVAPPTQTTMQPSQSATQNPLQNGIITCNTDWDPATLKFRNPCNFMAAVQLLQRVVDFMFWLAAPIAVIGFLYAGYLYMFAFSDPGNIKKAKELFKMVLLGFGIMLTAWVLVISIVKALGRFDTADSPLRTSDFQQFIRDF